MDKRISIEDELQPKPVSDKFKAMRAKHYNEMAAIKAFKQRQQDGSSESERSDEEEIEQHELITTNTNTNINTTTSKAEVCRPQRHSATSAGDVSDSAASSDRGERAPLAVPSCATRPAVALPGAPEPSNSRGINIKEEVQPKPSSDKFKAKRAQHYNEMAAIKAFKQKKQAGESSTESERSDEEADACRPQAKRPSEGSGANSDKRVGSNGSNASAAGGAGVRIAGPALVSTPPGASPDASPAPAKPSTEAEAAWKSKRNAHYSEMAAAMRNAPPPSDDEDEDEDD